MRRKRVAGTPYCLVFLLVLLLTAFLLLALIALPCRRPVCSGWMWPGKSCTDLPR
jgi:hypothetical protein